MTEAGLIVLMIGGGLYCLTLLAIEAYLFATGQRSLFTPPVVLMIDTLLASQKSAAEAARHKRTWRPAGMTPGQLLTD